MLLKNSKSSSGEYRFTYKPYNQSELVTFFAKATYKNGLQICSPIIAKNKIDFFIMQYILVNNYLSYINELIVYNQSEIIVT